MSDTRGGLAALCYILQVSWWMSLGLFGVTLAALPALSQDDGLAAFLNSASCSLLFYMFAFSESKLVTLLSRCLQYCGSKPPKILTIVLIILGLKQFFSGHPKGVFWTLVGCIIALGLDRFEAASAQAMDDYQGAQRNGDPLLDVLQPESGKSDEPDQPLKHEQTSDPEPILDLEQPDDAEPSDNTANTYAGDAHSSSSANKVAKPMSRARYWRIFGCFLALLVALSCWGLVLAQIAVGILSNSIVTSPIVIDDPHLLAPEVSIATNMKEALLPVSIPVSTPDFITTLGSPCQVAPTPTPVAKSAWIAAAMSTIMPTPEPTPSAMHEVEPELEPEPEPEPVVIPAEAFRSFQLMFEMHIAQGKSLLTWWLNLPTETQYAAITLSFVVAWTLFPLLAWMSIGSAGLAMAYFASASLFHSLRGHGLTRDHSLINCMAAGLAFTASLKAGFFFLIQLSEKSWNNATGLSKLTGDFEKFKQDTETSTRKFNRLAHRFNKTLKQLLGAIGQHATRLTRLESWRRNFTKRMDSLDEQVKQLQTSEADSKGLEKVQKEMEGIRTRFDELKNAEADAKAQAELRDKLEELSRAVSTLRESLGEVTTRLDGHDTKIRAAESGINALEGHVTEIHEKIGGKFMATTDTISGINQQSLDYKTKNDKRVGEAENNIEAMQKQVSTLEDSKATKEDLKPLQDEVTSIGNNVSDLRGSSDQLTTRLDEQDKVIEVTEGVVVELEGNVEKLEEDNEAMHEEINTLKESKATKEDLKQVLGVANSGSNDVKQLRSDTAKQHDEAMRATSELGASVDQRFEESNQTVTKSREENTALDTKLSARQSQLESSVNGQIQSTNDRVARVENAHNQDRADTKACLDGFSNRLDGVENIALQLQQLDLDELVHKHIERRLGPHFNTLLQHAQFLVMISNAVQLAIQDVGMGQMHAVAWDTVTEEECTRFLRGHLATMFKEQQARNNNNPGAPPGLSSGGRAGSPDAGPPNSSNSNHDDLEADPNTRSDPPVAPSGLSSGRRSPGLDGAAAGGPSGDAGSTPLPSAEDEVPQPGASDATDDDSEDDDQPDEGGFPGTSSVGDSTGNNGASGEKQNITRRMNNKQKKDSKWRREKLMHILSGKVVNKNGKVVDSHGVIFGRVVEGDVTKMIGCKCNEDRDILSESGDVIGHATLDVAILDGKRVNKMGNVMDHERIIYGRVQGATGRMVELTDRLCNHKGEVLNESGKVFRVELVKEDARNESNSKTGSIGKDKAQQATGSNPGSSSGLGRSRWGPSSGGGGSGSSSNGRNVSGNDKEQGVDNDRDPGPSSGRHEGIAGSDLNQSGGQTAETPPSRGRGPRVRSEPQKARYAKYKEEKLDNPEWHARKRAEAEAAALNPPQTPSVPNNKKKTRSRGTRNRGRGGKGNNGQTQNAQSTPGSIESDEESEGEEDS